MIVMAVGELGVTVVGLESYGCGLQIIDGENPIPVKKREASGACDRLRHGRAEACEPQGQGYESRPRTLEPDEQSRGLGSIS